MKRSVQIEMKTIEAMVRIYCRAYHSRDLCGECGEVLAYCLERLERCVYGPDKPACNQCTVHCYSPKMREKVKTIMRFSGPRMIYRHPYLAINHLIRERKKNVNFRSSIQ